MEVNSPTGMRNIQKLSSALFIMMGDVRRSERADSRELYQIAVQTEVFNRLEIPNVFWEMCEHIFRKLTDF